ncbi:tyrosine-type recombinase/integrase [Falsiroseomonas tokyonensis]|uniref:Tyrosine-type recombinase/integrase n=1 Tax=Falsiroseomonas tokyonensis TaxID=430521 RepID=A0ABV7BW75_9PROT|nr:tyrosine-type recombinase/integrase [Falsiroseomonas tokyonensis]MBU8538739.1 tyrosine-type recombinase/integrase [Falsiroseomonas tokyonensis]
MARIKLQTPNFKLSKRRDDIYEIRYTADGKLKSKSTGTRCPVEAEAFRARFAHDFNKPSISKRPTVEEICSAFESQRAKEVANPSGLKYALDPIRRHIGPLFGDGVTQTTVSEYIKKRREERPVRAGGRYGDSPVGAATMSKELRMLRAALNWAAAENLIPKAPTFRIELTSGAVRSDWLTKDEANLLMKASAPHLALFILIALSTAKRREAILSLKWDDVKLHLPGHEAIDFGDDVGNKRRGSTPIAGNKRLIDALRTAKDEATGPYVISYRGERIADVKTAIAAACRRAGIRSIGAHTLKHTAITWMVQADMTYERIAKFTNTSKDVIERVYGHHSPSFVAEASQAVSF